MVKKARRPGPLSLRRLVGARGDENCRRGDLYKAGEKPQNAAALPGVRFFFLKSAQTDLGFRKEAPAAMAAGLSRSEEHTSELQSLMRSSYAVFCLKKKNRISIVNTLVPPQSTR